MSDLIGKTIGQYQILEEIGIGGMATVYKAYQRSVNRFVAIKVLPTQFARDRVFVKRFHEEAKAIAALEHLHILPLHDFGTEDGYTYMVMRYVTGGTLADLMGQPLPYEQIVKIIGDIARALDYAHQQGVIHRDIKPSNILIDSHGEALLTDFGIAKSARRSASLTKLTGTGLILGTPEYVAPEQAEDGNIDGRSDIYSLGVVLYELLTGRPPYQAKTPLAVVMMHVKSTPPPSPRSIKPNIPEPLERVVMKALAKDPNQRFQTAGEMDQALRQSLREIDHLATIDLSLPQAVQNGEMSRPAQPATPPPTQWPATPASTTAPSSRKFGWLALILSLLLLGGIAFVIFGGKGGAATPTQQPAAIVEEQATATPTETVLPGPTATPTGVPVLTAMATAPAEETPLVEDTPTVEETPPVEDTPTSEATPVVENTPTETPAATVTPTAEPGTTSSPTPTETPTELIPVSSLVGTIAYPVFNGTDYDIYFGQADGSETQFYRAHASQPAFSSTGTRIAFHSWQEDEPGLIAMDLSGANGYLVTNFPEDLLPTWSADGHEIILLTRRTSDRRSQLFRVSSIQEVGPTTTISEGEYPTVGLNGQLVFKGWGNTGTGLRLASAGFGNFQAVSDLTEDTAPALSPDGQEIAFMSRRDGNWEIYLIEADGSGLKRLTTEPADDGLPTWSPDGQVLAFVSNRGGSWAVWAMTPTGAGQRQLFAMEGSPDGFVGTNRDASRGWTEERISWTR